MRCGPSRRRPQCEDNRRMSMLTSEAVVLRTWPVHEADLIVSFFTRDYGKVRGVAKSALKSRKRFGGALESMTVARAWFAERPRQELVRLDQLEIVRRSEERRVGEECRSRGAPYS